MDRIEFWHYFEDLYITSVPESFNQAIKKASKCFTIFYGTGSQRRKELRSNTAINLITKPMLHADQKKRVKPSLVK
jgi:hypothetical protein